ncbi:peptidoglycan-associated lipoprotein Pal [Saccharobesus litoralis]|uniref:Peptidoglycan-associated lipoprotein n=1 Tax=Saccharobesus litoralis TaxID=2172099 RepID=A0A2S0VWG5_9ALTE|nr:peptidoglycan-associated lipoprotein Pal [Saccharobesus litoralis]AWB68558.1 peptidoglycan-associated lipoprotein Pal [Saccharobesus litoralis]
MQPSKTLKALALALPILTLTACGTTGEDADSSAATNKAGSAAAQATDGTAGGANAVLSPAQRAAKLKEEKRKQQAKLRQSTTINFEFDQARIGGSYFEMLEAHAIYLSENSGVKVRVEGHADERGTPEYNIALGERRAKAVARHLENLGVSSSQISVVSYGEEKPLDRSRTESAFAANRRAVLVY